MYSRVFTGLLPGIHINFVSAFIISNLAFLSFGSPLALVVFIVAMTISHTFFDFIPSVFLGAPDEDSVLSVLPGHELLLKGRGYEAVVLTLYGGVVGLIISLLFFPVFIFVFPRIYFYLHFIMFFILVLANLYLIFREKNKLLAFIVFMLSGFLGIITLNLPVGQALLPLLTGLFGASSLITSISKKDKIPRQKITKIKIKKELFVKPGIASILVAPLCSFLPSLGSGQAAVLGSDVVDDLKRREFLVLLGMINSLVASLSFVTLYSLGKARTGTAVAVQSILDNFSLSSLFFILVVIILAGIISFFLAIAVSRKFSNYFGRLNYRILSGAILGFICLVVLVFSGWLGFLVFIVACLIGLFTIKAGVRRTQMMGSLMLPSILLYLPF